MENKSYEELVLEALHQILVELKEIKEQKVVNNTTYVTKNVTATEDFFANLDSLIRTNKN